MIIERLVLKNFKRFKVEEIHFKDGITGILGNNGTGKSSIVQAIFFALYGVQATGLSADYIVSSFASPRERCEVRLDFRIGGESYTVVRTFKKGKSVQHDATFHRDGKLRATGVSQVETEVRRTLGMGPVDFRNTVYAAQKDLLTLLENTPGKRKEWFLRALGIDYLNTESQKILKDRVDAQERELQLLEGELKALSERQSAEEFTALQVSVAEFNHTLGMLKEQHAGQLEKKKAIEEEFRQFSEKKTEYTRLVERHQSLTREAGGLIRQRDLVKTKLIDLARQQQEYRGLEERISTYPEKKQALESLRKLKSESDRIQADARFAERECAELKNRAKKSQAKITAFHEDAAHRASFISGVRKTLTIKPEIPDNDLEQTITSYEETILHTIGTLSAQQKRLITEKKKLLSDRETIKNAGADGICPLCRQTLGSHYTDIEQEFKFQLQNIKNEVLEVRENLELATKGKEAIDSQKPVLSEIRSLSEKLKMWDPIEIEHKDLLAQLQTKELAHQVLMQKITELRFDERIFAQTEKEIKELEQVQARFNDLREKLARGAVFKKQVAELEGQIKQKQIDLAKLKSEIEQSSFDPKKGDAIEEVRAEIETVIRSTDAEIARTKERLRHTEEKIADYKKAEAQIAGLQQGVIALKEEIDLLKLTRSVIADYVIYLMQVVRSRIEGEVSRIISEITSGRYEQVLLDEDFNLLVRDIDNDYSIERFSGGEQDDIAVALRIALSRYLAELHQVHESTLLIFDEIFGSQDEERRTNLLTTLRTQESRFPQIILISHIQEMQGEFTNTLVVEMGTDLISRVKEVA